MSNDVSIPQPGRAVVFAGLNATAEQSDTTGPFPRTRIRYAATGEREWVPTDGLTCPAEGGRLASYRVIQPGLAELTVENSDYTMAVQVPADILARIVERANRPAGVAPDGHMTCLVCGHPVIRNSRGELQHADFMSHAYQHTAVIETMASTAVPQLPYVLRGEGHAGGVEYVTVLDAGGNPVEYNIPRHEAVSRYAAELDC